MVGMTDAEKREKVIKGLSICIPETEVHAEQGCTDCPYWVCGDTVSLPVRLIEDIRALLKAQEPRVMTAEDMWKLKFNDTVIIEQKIPSLLIPAIVRDNIKYDDALEVLQVVTASTNGTANADYEYYGKTWRCWTSRPTDEQREATPWQ